MFGVRERDRRQHVMSDELTHVDAGGRLRMVDVGDKGVSRRSARVCGEINMLPETALLIAQNRITKGNVLEAARLAAIMAAKRTGELIPLCHPINVTAVDVSFEVGKERVVVEVEARVEDRTGVEMEALTAAAVALLTIYDMCKAVDRGMVISNLRLIEKRGGASGSYVATPPR